MTCKLHLALLFVAISTVCAVPKSMTVQDGSGTVDSVKNKYAVLTEYLAHGSNNVRWETMPNNFVGSDGKPVGQKMSGKEGAYGCLDIQGRQQANGDEYTRPNGKFKYRCNNGIEEVVACISSSRAGQKWIKVDDSLEVNGFWHKCQSFPNGSVIYTQENACGHNGKEYHVGEELHVGFLNLECQNDGYKVIGCIYLDENQKEVKLERGAKKTIGKTVHYCEEKDGDLQYSSVANGCTKNGKEYKEGEEFQQNHLKYKCENGITKILGCYIDEKTDLAIGKDSVDEASHMVHRCYRVGGAVEYQEYACGVNGAGKSCHPDPVPVTPDDAPKLAPGLKAPGYSTFAIIQTGGTGMAAAPGNLKLDLEKILANVRQH
uniref:DUF3421 domain-containing protein n=1 Tax=Panagrellus redivivus TaxID=6233 RepID=A0A7E4ZTJ9_PANRE